MGEGDAEDDNQESARLLVISDEKFPPEWLRMAQAIGFDYDLSVSSQALTLLKSSLYHAALVNLSAPPQSLALIEQARNLTNCRQVPLAVLAERENLNAAFKAGASFALPRPITPELLENTLGAIYRVVLGLRRQYARYRVELPLILQLEGRAIEAKATDIGTGGMALVASEPLPLQTKVSVRFKLPGSEQEIVVVGEIRWTDHLGRAGLSFNLFAEPGRHALDDWMARRHLGIERRLPALPPPPPAASVASFEVPPEPAPLAGRIVLGAFFAIFSLLMLAFWIYFAITS